MVAIFTGLGAGAERGSASVLGGAGLLGGGTLGRSGEQVLLNAATGNLMIAQQDEMLTGRGLDASVARTYNSLGDLSDDNGDNWRQSTDRRVYGLTGTVNTAGSTVERVSADGSEITYSWNTSASAYVATDGAGAYDRLTWSAGTSAWTWTDGDSQVTETYGQLIGGQYFITRQTDPSGNALTFSYVAGTSHVDKVTTANGEYIQYSWSGNNITQMVTGYTDLTTSTAKTLTRTRYSYDGSNRLWTVTVDLSPEDNSIADGKVYTTTYGYDGTSKRVATITETDGSSLAIGYDASGRVHTLTQTVASGVTRTTTIDYLTSYTNITDALGQVTRLDYDGNDQLKRIVAPPAYTGAASQGTYFYYTSGGDVDHVTDAAGNTTTYTYDANGNVLTVTDPLNNVVTRTYNAKNQVLTETHASDDETGAGVLNTTRYVYDTTTGLLRFEIDGEGRVVEHRYTSGMEQWSIQYTGLTYNVSVLASNSVPLLSDMTTWVTGLADQSAVSQTFFAYDARGNLINSYSYSAATSPGGSGSSYTAMVYVYDQASQLLSRRNNLQASETFVYDGLGRLTASTDLTRGTTSIVFNDSSSSTVVTLASGVVQTSTYNKAGELISFGESGSYTTVGTTANTYDQLGRLRQTTDATGNNSYFEYDKVGRKVADIDQFGNVTEYKYDLDNRVIATVRYATALTSSQLSSLQSAPTTFDFVANRPVGVAADIWTFNFYDADSRIIETVDGSGGVAAYAYDASGQLVKTTHYANKLTTTQLALIKARLDNRASGALNRVGNSQFDGATGWMTGYNPQNIVNSGSPSIGTSGGISYLQTAFTATAAGQVASISTGANDWFPVSAGERLAVSAGVAGQGPVSALVLSINWLDANGNSLPTTNIGQVNGAAAFNTVISGFATAPAGAVKARLEIYMSTSAAGAGSFSMIQPMVSSATATQTSQPPFLPSPIFDATRDAVTRNFYDKSGRVIGALDGQGYISKIVYDAAGRKVSETAFANPTGGNRASDSFNTLVASAGTSAADRTAHYVYDGQGLLIFSVDALNHVTEFSYPGANVADITGQVRETVQYAGVIGAPSAWTIAGVRNALSAANLTSSPDNRMSWAIYDTHGNLAYAIDPTGAVSGYKYDAAGNVAKVTQFAQTRTTTSLPNVGDMDTWAGTYGNGNDRVTRNYYDARGELRYTIDAEGYISRIDYDANGRTVGTTRWDTKITASLTVTDATTIAQVAVAAAGTYVATATSYDADGRISTTTDGANIVTRYAYNANGTLESTYQANGTADEVRTRYVYDAAGRVQTRYDAYLTSEQQATTFTYDAFGNKLSQTDATGATTSWTYDLAGNVLTETDALTNVTHYEYNAFGEVVKATDPLGGITYSYYDTLGRVVLVRDAENYGTKYDYTAFGEVKAVTRYGARTTDAASTTTLPTFPADAADAVTQFTYDKLGRLKRTTDALNNWEENTYNAFGQVSQNQGKLGLITTYTYDRRGLLSTIVVNAPVYNSAGAQVAASYTSHSYGYDARGNMVSDTEAVGLAEQRVTTYVYDKLDRVIETHLPQVQNTTNTGLVSPVEYYKYDGRGNVIEVKDAAGARTLSYYDDLDRVTVQIDPLGTYTTFTYAIVVGTGSNVVTKSYDTQVGLPATAGGTPPAAPAGTLRQTTSNYNKLGQLTSTVVTGILTGKLVGSTYTTNASTTLTTGYTYDANGNVKTVTDPNGGVIYSYYDKLGRKTAQVDAGNYFTSWTLDTNGNVTSERRYALAVGGVSVGAPPTATNSVDDRVTNFTYDKMGRRWTETRTGLTYWTIDPTATTGALSLVTNGSSTITYTYNALGEVLSKTEAATNTGSSVHDATNYTYDAAGRLTHTAGASFTDYAGNTVQGGLDYSYDALGNVVRTVQNAARVTTYAYGAGGRLLSMTDPTGAASAHTYYYDIAGRKIGEAYDRAKSNGTILHEGLSYQYDLNGNLTRQAFATVAGGVFSDAGDVTTIAYNAHGEATSRSLNGVVQGQYRYDNAGRLEASNANGGVWSYYLYDANGNQTAEIDDEGKAGVNLVNQSLANVLSIATAGGSSAIGGTYIDGINATLTTYGARNRALSSTQTKRQLTGTGTPVDITSSQLFNAFGELATQTDALGNTTTYAYNTMGRRLSVTHPTTTVTGTNGVDNTSATPTEYYYYDASGRLIGQMDANGNVVTRSLLAGTGYGQSDALVVNEYHPDGGVAKSGYDVFGDLRKVTDEIGRVTNNTFDAMGRLTQVSHYGGLVDTYAYDVLGQRIRHTNNLATDAETTDYDVQGRVVTQVAFGGDTTSTSYVWSGTMATTGLGTFGGYTQTTTYQNSMTSSENDDAFGHVISQTDMSGRVYNYTYDTAARVVSKTPVISSVTVAADTLNYTYYNTGLVNTVIKGTYGSAASQDTFDYSRMVYGYDKMGRDVSEIWDHQSGGWYDQGYYDHFGEWVDQGEVYQSGGATLQQSAAQYDALGRMIEYDQTVDNATMPVTITWKYDAVGNVREKKTLHFDVLTNGSHTTTQVPEDDWYLYDSMGRMTLDRGSLVSGAIVRGDGATAIEYDAAGERIHATSSTTLTVTVWDPNAYDPNAYGGWGGNTGNYVNTDYVADRREDYSYTSAGNLYQVYVAQGGYNDNGDGTVTATPPPATGTLTGNYIYDLMNRVTQQKDYQYGTTVAYQRDVTYNAKGQVDHDIVSQLIGSGSTTTTTYYGYGTGAGYALGTAISTNWTATGSSSGSGGTTTSLYWYAGAQAYKTTTSQAGTTSYDSTFTYDSYGTVTGITVGGAKARNVYVYSDLNGQTVDRNEWNSSGNSPHEMWYRFAGLQLGYIGNNGTANTDYLTSVQARNSTGTGYFRGGASSGVSYADFDQSYDSYTSYAQGSGGGSYTVQTGDTLSGIAQRLWGDASLWYKLAEANGMSGDAGLVEGQTLTIPAGVSRTSNTSSTFRPYDPSDAVGDISGVNPVPKPKNQNKCGVFGQILLAVVAIAVTVALPHIAPALFASGALGGLGTVAAAVAGNIVSQGVGLATGIQKNFDFAGLALTALTAGVAKGLDKIGVFDKVGVGGAGFGAQVAQGAITNLVTQGIGVAVGLQTKFDWAGVAAAGLGAGVSVLAGKAVGDSLGKLGGKAFKLIASDVAGAAARSVINGTDFGDNLIATLPDVLGRTIGELVGNEIGKQFDSTGSAIAGTATASGQLGINGGAQDILGPTSQYSIDINNYFAGQAIVSNLLDGNRNEILRSVGISRSAPGDDASNSQDIVVTGRLSESDKIAIAAAAQTVAAGGVAGGKANSEDRIGFLKYNWQQGNNVAKFFLSNPTAYGSIDSGWHKNYAQKVIEQAVDTGAYWDIDTFVLPAAREWAKTDPGWNDEVKLYQAYVDSRNAIADREVNKFLAFSVGIPLVAAGTLALAPVAAGYFGTSAALHFGTRFLVGGLGGMGIEYMKNTAFDLKGTPGGYTSAFFMGGVGGGGINPFGTSFLARAAQGSGTAMLGDLLGQNVDISIGYGGKNSIDWRQTGANGVIGFAVGGLIPDLEIDGLNAGRGNAVSAFNGKVAGIGNGTVRFISPRLQLRSAAGIILRPSVQNVTSAGYQGMYGSITEEKR